MSVYSYLFAVFVACISYLVYQRYGNVYPSIISKAEKRYDYIIVGAGTAGCVLAARLSEDPGVTVLLVEAGQHMGYFTRIPLTATAAQQGPDDWSVRTTRQKYSSFGLWDQSQIIPRGKGLGGSGQINFLLHGFGMPEDFDRWSSRGFRNWGLEDLKPYFVRAFGTDRSEFNSDNRCSDGLCSGNEVPMKLQLIDDQNELLRIFQKASASLGSRHTQLRKATATVREGVRYSTLDAYLKTALNRRNLHVVLRTQAISVRFDNKNASSLFILRNNRELDNVFANKEIILCAGAIKTPQILMLSGIGPRDILQRTIVEKHQGPILKIKFAVSFNTKINYNTDTVSKEYCIDDSAKVCFKFKIDKTSNYLKPALQAKKHNLAKNSTVKITVCCPALNYSEQWVCTDDTYWNEMGEISHDSSCEHVNIYHIDIDINVCKEQLIFPSLYEDVEFSDFKLSTPEGSMAVHKSCLAAHSDVFRTMFSGAWRETTIDSIELEGVTLETLQQFKDYLYLGSLPEDGLRPLLLLANYYLIENLEAECISQLVKSVTPENLYGLLEFALENKISELTFNILRKTPRLDDVVQRAHQIMKKKQNANRTDRKSSHVMKCNN